MNGCSPIHVAVLLGNLRLVHRFAIVLNALNQNVDVANGQGMVSSSLHLMQADGCYLLDDNTRFYIFLAVT